MHQSKVWKKTSKSFYRFQQRFVLNSLNAKVAIIETSQLVLRANMAATLAFNELTHFRLMFSFHTLLKYRPEMGWRFYGFAKASIDYFHRYHSFSTCEYQGVRSVSLSENFANVLNKWSHRSVLCSTNGRFEYNDTLQKGVILDCKQKCYWKIAL